jgi:hypothetical protein
VGEARNLFSKWLDRNGFDENVISKFDRAALIATHDDRDDTDAWRDMIGNGGTTRAACWKPGALRVESRRLVASLRTSPRPPR